MKNRVLCLLTFFIGCSRTPVTSLATTTVRPAVPPVWEIETQTNRQTPDPACTCASPESFPAPTKFEAECDERFAVCGDVHYVEYLARLPSLPHRDRLGKLLAVHRVESMIYDATITFPSPRNPAYAVHDSTMRVHRGDIIPTPHGPARVVQVYRSFSDGDDDGRVRLHFFDRFASASPELLYVSSGAPSSLDGGLITLIAATGGAADVVFQRGVTETLFHVRKGDTIGTFPVVEVVDGRAPDAELGWVTIDTTK
jgi:hypothetical protein